MSDSRIGKPLPNCFSISGLAFLILKLQKRKWNLQVLEHQENRNHYKLRTLDNLYKPKENYNNHREYKII